MTLLRQILDPAKLHQAVADGLVRMNTSPMDDKLVLFNYTEKCAWEKTWTLETLQCRGLIVERGDDPVVIARPYSKFFNWDERPLEEKDMTGPVEVTDKMDGSLGIGYRYNGCWRVATRGSFASDQAVWATQWLNENFSHFSPPGGLTPMWEIIYPANRIVVNYQGWAGLVLLGWRHIGSGRLLGPMEYGDAWLGARAEVMDSRSYPEALALEPRANAEGVVVRWRESGLQVKIKQDDYKRLHAVVTNTTNRTIWKALSTGTEIDLAGVPDEFMKWVAETQTDLFRQHMELRNAVIAQYAMILAQLPLLMIDRKGFALKAKGHPYAAPMFKLLDGKDITGWVWAQLKPETIERPFQES